MRSFIKSHRKSNSLDESPAKTHSSTNDAFHSFRPSAEPLEYMPTTPSQVSQTFNGTKNSPGFEPFHRLANKKMFSSKLFKKSSTALSSQVASSITKESSSAPGTPQVRRWDMVPEHSNSTENLSKFPAIKGTITHSWGDHSKNTQPVIRLNNPSLSSSDLTSDLEPAIRISSLKRGSVASSLTCSSNDINTVNASASTEVSHQTIESQRDRHNSNQLSKVKSKNRQVRIHSHDDILLLQKNSSVSLQLLASTGTPKTVYEELSEHEVGSIISRENESLEASPLGSDQEECPVHTPSGLLGENLLNTLRPKSATSENDDTSDCLNSFNENDPYDDEDNSSKFSFEINGINGRTSSVKYYSKPEPAEAIYLDDMYEDEIFDEDMNFYEDSLEEIHFPSNDIDANSEADSHHDEEPNSKPVAKISKPMKTYNDLFDLSDSDEDELLGDEDPGDDADDEFGDDAGHLYHNHSDGIFSKRINQQENSSNTYSADEEVPESTYNKQEQDSKPELAYRASGSDTTGNYLGSKIKSVATKDSSSNPIKSFSDIFDLDNEEDDELCDNVKSEFSSDGDETAAKEQSFYLSDKMLDVEGTLQSSSSMKGIMTNVPKTPIHIFVTSPDGPSSKTPDLSSDGHSGWSSATQTLPPPARSQALKYHDLSSNLDSEISGVMSNLYFIDETEEDNYNEKHKLSDDDYIDEINTVPEDFNFSDSDRELGGLRSPMRCSRKDSFRSTHSYSGQPTGAAKENTPTRNKLEIKNKTVTFFNNSTWDHSPSDNQRQMYNAASGTASMLADEYIISPNCNDAENFHPVTPANSFSKPTPEYLNDYSLSPIQETSSSVDNSPVRNSTGIQSRSLDSY